MKSLLIAALLVGSGSLVACATVATTEVATADGTCGTYGFVDANNDGAITGDEWNMFRSGAYAGWDVDHDGRIGRSEFEHCYRGGGFYRSSYYHPDSWTGDWGAFDADNDGFLSPDEFWSTSAWGRLDRNADGRIGPDEWSR